VAFCSGRSGVVCTTKPAGPVRVTWTIRPSCRLMFAQVWPVPRSASSRFFSTVVLMLAWPAGVVVGAVLHDGGEPGFRVCRAVVSPATANVRRAASARRETVRFRLIVDRTASAAFCSWGLPYSTSCRAAAIRFVLLDHPAAGRRQQAAARRASGRAASAGPWQGPIRRAGPSNHRQRPVQEPRQLVGRQSQAVVQDRARPRFQRGSGPDQPRMGTTTGGLDRPLGPTAATVGAPEY
jgi:hypothetical protein